MIRLALLVFALSGCAALRSAPRCQLPGATLEWMEGSLAAWEDVREHALRLPARPLPRLVFYDRFCAYDFPEAGDGPVTLAFGANRLRGRAAAHEGRIQLPNAVSLPLGAEAFASLLPGDTATFLAMALEDVWRHDPETRDAFENWSAFLRRSFVHEMTHTRQLVTWAPLLRVAGGRIGLVDVDDDVIQQRFGDRPDFRASVLTETALLFRAAASGSAPERRELAREALQRMLARRAATYGDVDAPWARVEQILLDMEGAAQWAALAHVDRATRLPGREARRDLVRGSRQYWSQDQGLALYMLLNELVPDWPARMFADDPPSSLELLERALR